MGVRKAALAVVLGGLCMTGAATAAPCGLQDLTWMAGVWRNHDGGRTGEERWTIGPNGRLLGASWVLHDDRAGGDEEIMTVIEGPSGAEYHFRRFDATLDHAVEEKAAPMVFTVAACRNASATFAGTGGHAGERFTYSRADGRLRFVGDFMHNGAPFHTEEAFDRAGD